MHSIQAGVSPLKSIHDSSGELAWVPASNVRRDSDLIDGVEVIARLRWQRMFQALASGETTDGVWLFKLEGFLFRQFVAIHQLGEPEPEAIFNASPAFNGVLEMKGGRSYYWDSNFWLTRWIWSDTEGAEIMRAQRHLTIRMEGSLTIPSEYLGNEDLPLLALLGWYLIQIVSDLRIG